MDRTTVDRVPILVNRAETLAASATGYYPNSSGQDRFGGTMLTQYVQAIAYADEAGTLTLEDSDDGSTWATLGSALTVTADVAVQFPWTKLTKRYWRWKLVNGATIQGFCKIFEDKTPDLRLVATNLVTMQNAAAATGNGTSLGVTGYGTAALDVRGTFVGTVTFEATTDGTNWESIAGAPLTYGSAPSTASSAIQLYFNVAGKSAIRARISAYSSGSITVTGRAIGPVAPTHITATIVGWSSTTANVTGNVAHDAADSGNPVKIGGKASTSEPAAVANADRVDAYFDANGYQMVKQQGTVAHDAADSGNPIKVGGKANAAAPAAVTEGDRVDASFTLEGRLRTEAGGDVAHDAVDAGGPLKIGGYATDSAPGQVAAADRVNAWFNRRGGQAVMLTDSGGDAATIASPSADSIGPTTVAGPDVLAHLYGHDGTNQQRLRVDAQKNLLVGLRSSGGAEPNLGTFTGTVAGVNGLLTWARQAAYNGSEYEPWRNNIESTDITSAARTAELFTAALTNLNGKGIQVAIHASAKVGTTTLTVRLMAWNATSGVYAIKATSAAFAAAAGVTYTVDFAPGLVAADYVSPAQGKAVAVPRVYKLSILPSDTDSVTYSGSVSTML